MRENGQLLQAGRVHGRFGRCLLPLLLLLLPSARRRSTIRACKARRQRLQHAVDHGQSLVLCTQQPGVCIPWYNLVAARDRLEESMLAQIVMLMATAVAGI